MLWLWLGPPESDCWFSLASAFQLFLAIESSLSFHLCITKICLNNFDPLKPHFYIVKLRSTGVYIIFLFLLKNIDCGYSLEPPSQGGSNEYTQSMFWAKIWKIYQNFYLKMFSFWWWKFQYIWIGVFSKWYSFDFYVLGDVVLRNPSRGLS